MSDTREIECLSCGKDFTVKEFMMADEKPKCTRCGAIHRLDLDSDGELTFWYVAGLCNE